MRPTEVQRTNPTWQPAASNNFSHTRAAVPDTPGGKPMAGRFAPAGLGGLHPCGTAVGIWLLLLVVIGGGVDRLLQGSAAENATPEKDDECSVRVQPVRRGMASK
jgi:hypothetical protein